MADWAEAQGKDPDLLLVHKFMASSDPTPELIGVSRDVRSYWRGRQQLLMVEGVICRRWVDPQPGKPGHEQIIVPRQMRSSVLTEFHDNGGHVPRNLPICAILKLRSAILKFEDCAGNFKIACAILKLCLAHFTNTAQSKHSGAE